MSFGSSRVSRGSPSVTTHSVISCSTIVIAVTIIIDTTIIIGFSMFHICAVAIRAPHTHVLLTVSDGLPA